MQNFTLRIRGTKLFLLSFVLFMGGLSMYGQSDCPTPTGTLDTQSFCYLQTVDAIVTDGTTIYRSEDGTTPVPDNELLEDGVTYFVGNADGTCTTRLPVTVTVTSSPAPVTGYGTTFSPALGSTADSYDVDDLIATLQDDNPGDNLVVFAGQFDETPLAGNTELIAENSYFVGIDNGGCPSERLAMRYDPIVAVAPTGDAAQTFCDGATVADLVAQGTSENTTAIRWYSTETSNPNLGDDVVLVNGETYYATQIINNVGSALPPTESEERFEVTVTVIPPVNAGDDASTEVCSNDASLDLFTLLSGDADTDGTFTLDGADINGQFDPANYTAGTYTITYTVADDCTTDDATFTITLTDQPEAPVVADQEFCETDNATVADLGTDADVSVYDDASLTTELDPTTPLMSGTYYAVATNGSCVSETTEFEITISEQPDAPVIADMEFCETDNATVADLGTDADVAVYDDASLTTELDPATPLTSGTYYAVATNGSCISATTDFEITISEQPDAPVIADMSFCETENATVADLGTDANVAVYDDASLSSALDPSTALMDGTYYAVATNGSCISETTEFNVTITPAVAPEAGDDMAFDACINDTVDLTAYLSDDALSTGEFTGDGVTGSTFTATTADTYTITYTVNDANSCVPGGTSDSATFTITVNNPTPADAGEDMEISACVNENVDLLSYLADSTNASGEFTGEGVTGSTFTATTAGDYTITYTIDDQDNCVTAGTSDSATFTITVNTPSDAEAGDDMEISACVNETIMLADYLSDDAITSGEFTGDMVTDGMFTATTAGTYTITYTVDEDDTCVNAGTSDSATFTVTVNAPTAAEAGEDDEISACVNETIDLSSYLSADANTTGEFTGDGVTGSTFNATTAGTYTVTYSVDDEDYCVTTGTSDSATFTITVNNPTPADAGEDMEISACVNENVDLLSYLADSTNASGEFTGEGVTGSTFTATTAGDYTITYTVDDQDYCVTAGTSDSATFTITVNTPSDAEAGDDMEISACVNETIMLADYLSDDAISSGEFTGDMVTDGMFTATTAGTYTITYTIDEDDACVADGTSDTATFTVSVNAPTAAEAGEDDEISACVNETIDLSSYLSADANTTGEFTGDGVTGTSFTSATAGTYTVTYSVDDEDYCVTAGTSDSSTFTITVNEPSEAEAGDDAAFTLCVNESVDLFEYLSDDAITSGEFTGDMVTDGMFMATTDGTYTITYSLDEDDTCVTAGTSDSATFTITVNPDANAGEDVTVADGICVADTTVDLSMYLNGADDNGIFSLDGTDLADANFDISTAGVYEFIYTVTNDCGTDSSTLTITVNEVPDAPVVTDGDFCAIDGATFADLDITGDNIGYYTSADADPDNMIESTDVLTSGTYYVTQMSAAGCESETAAITVTVNDPGTPTIDASQFEICEYDERTVAYLTDGITSGGDITWYDAAEGGSAISESALLVDGMTYYASAYNSTTGCESAVRLAYTVNFTDCTIRFQEGISPNGDGLNDTFDIQYLEDEYPNYAIEIYNRWGNMVYKGNASTPNWDGTPTESSLGDDVLPVGVYFYVIEFNDGSTPARQGKVYLSR
ncbi:gliding motility-associated C-terminal domain-containing protein [Zunongwangia sp. SCSIO 43204]|uniref:gliding motility-associated C-terminal domain-containing protein n=1 Tax=Zunongwangia sp. SCSIO 43204 TaxID=2779359 RepID=UPI001CA7E338|nr:gliding motility-associated C-terminal domain-containing protein [Zunongwangia sp. SCSIO 43204]UAB84665.1 gliding motility-associated C-terminal domain-containing protein [Zunongwangia sp. SCSIO 43204]